MRKELTDEEILATILDKLTRIGKWAHVHTSYDKITKQIANKIKRNGKRVRKIIDGLIKAGFIISKPTSYGTEVSLNFKRKKEIINIIRKVFH